MIKRISKKDRNKFTRKTKNIVLIATEGKNKTETIYFSAFNKLKNSYRIIFAQGSNTDPVGIVNDMVKTINKENIDLTQGDIAVCVFDVDFEEYKLKQINSAYKIAKNNGIQIITSNPCFEV